MMKLFSFDHLITPSIIKFLFYAGIVVSALGGLGIVLSAGQVMQYSALLGLGYIVGGFIVLVVGIVSSRVFTEMILVFFMIRDELAWQRENVTMKVNEKQNSRPHSSNEVI